MPYMATASGNNRCKQAHSQVAKSPLGYPDISRWVLTVDPCVTSVSCQPAGSSALSLQFTASQSLAMPFRGRRFKLPYRQVVARWLSEPIIEGITSFQGARVLTSLQGIVLTSTEIPGGLGILDAPCESWYACYVSRFSRST